MPGFVTRNLVQISSDVSGWSGTVDKPKLKSAISFFFLLGDGKGFATYVLFWVVFGDQNVTKGLNIISFPHLFFVMLKGGHSSEIPRRCDDSRFPTYIDRTDIFGSFGWSGFLESFLEQSFHWKLQSQEFQPSNLSTFKISWLFFTSCHLGASIKNTDCFCCICMFQVQDVLKTCLLARSFDFWMFLMCAKKHVDVGRDDLNSEMIVQHVWWRAGRKQKTRRGNQWWLLD